MSSRPAGILSGLLILALSGCGARTPDQEKADSWPDASPDQRAGWGTYLACRTAQLICRDPSGQERSDGSFLATLGVAIVISEDGYLLSSAHAVAGDGPYWISLEPGKHLPCRLVWRSPVRPNDDWALLKVDQRFPDTLSWSRAAPMVGDGVITGSATAPPSRGRLDGQWLRHASGHSFTILIHSAPLTQGDSGGPVVDAEGALLGISYGIDQNRRGRWQRSWAVRPDPAFVQGLMDQDRRGPDGDGDGMPGR